MDLTSFTSSSKKKSKQEEILVDNDEVLIKKIDNELEFLFRKEEALDKYQNFIFMGPTHAIISDSEEEAQSFFEKSLSEGVEGLMFKNLNAPYSPGLRSGSMAKLKETKEDIDVVIVGAEHGTGKRAGYYSSFIVAVSNEESSSEEDSYLEIGKVASGIKEIGSEGISMENLTKLLTPYKISENKGIVKFKPKIIIQVKYQEIQKSPSYSSGFALRFPRIIMLREDKSLNEINTISDIAKFYQI
ncbi:MAG: hypothetical protein KC589_09590 [Nanoarchaeota archaeon]|nr:hypothetical protein [Nanoarchaeota archaeon]MCA9497174.1 hypothetical protein [Nanoarchaeota archaeon]